MAPFRAAVIQDGPSRLPTHPRQKESHAQTSHRAWRRFGAAGRLRGRGPGRPLHNHYANHPVSDGDPALAFGPRYLGGGSFSTTQSRLYYANLAAALPGTAPFKGAEAIAVSHTDDVVRATAGYISAWRAP